MDDEADESSEQSEEDIEADDKSAKRGHQQHNFGLAPAKNYKYTVELPSLSGGSNIKLSVFASQISRPKGLLTKDKVQIILKDSCEAANNIWVVKVGRERFQSAQVSGLTLVLFRQDNLKEKFSLNTMKFEQIFKGGTPKFDVTFGRGEFSKLNRKMPTDSKRLNSSVQSHSLVKSPSKMLTKSKSASQLKPSQSAQKRDEHKHSKKAVSHPASNGKSSANTSRNPTLDQETQDEKEKLAKHQRSLKAQKIQNKSSN